VSLGSTIRRAFGPAEPAVAAAYRRIFVDMGRFVEIVRDWTADATVSAVLDVGCGEGQITEALSNAFPTARFLAIDVSPRLGRLFRGDRRRVDFRKVRVEDVAAREPDAFDLVVMSDVLHHVDVGDRRAFMAAAARALRPGGALVLKDWERLWSPAHIVAFVSDRIISRDAGVRYCTLDELREHVRSTGLNGPLREARVRPWRNNVVLMARRGGGPSSGARATAGAT
jgi:2-polyprenyl-3-methyl-5-hydroxy-6-metoxy-1,4-benzoquinol methylase